MYFSRVKVASNIGKLSQLHNVLRGNGHGVHQLLWDLFAGREKRSFLFREEIVGEQLPHYRGARGEPIYYIVSQSEPATTNPLFAVESKPYNPKLTLGTRLSFKLRANPTISRKEEGKKNSVRHDVVMDAHHHLLRELARDAGLHEVGKKSDLKGQILKSWLGSKKSEITEKLQGNVERNERYREILEQKPSLLKLLETALKANADLALETWLTEKGNKKGFRIACDKKWHRLQFQAEGYRWHALPKKGRSAGFSSVDFEGEIEVTNPELFLDALFTGIGPAKAFGCGLMLVRRL